MTTSLSEVTWYRYLFSSPLLWTLIPILVLQKSVTVAFSFTIFKKIIPVGKSWRVLFRFKCILSNRLSLKWIPDWWKYLDTCYSINIAGTKLDSPGCVLFGQYRNQHAFIPRTNRCVNTPTHPHTTIICKNEQHNNTWLVRSVCQTSSQWLQCL